MLLETSDLPGDDWRQIAERIWRTGMFGKPSETWRRARSLGTFTATRSFEQSNVPRWLLIKVAPVASSDDARDVVPELLSLSMPNPYAEVAVTSERPVLDVPVDGLSDPWGYEKLTAGMPDGPTASRYLAGHVDEVAILIECSGGRDVWSWEEIAFVATEQASRIESQDHQAG
jgi:hypothetical protein